MNSPRGRRPVMVAGLLAVVLAAALVWIGHDSERPSPTPAAAQGPSPSTSPGPPPTRSGPNASPSPHRDGRDAPPPATATPGPKRHQAPWRRVAEGFARDFAHPSAKLAPWRRRVSRWTTPELADSYATVDPRQIPSDTLESVDKSAAGVSAVDVTAAFTSGLRLLIRLETGPHGWRVTTVEPMSEN